MIRQSRRRTLEWLSSDFGSATVVSAGEKANEHGVMEIWLTLVAHSKDSYEKDGYANG